MPLRNAHVAERLVQLRGGDRGPHEVRRLRRDDRGGGVHHHHELLRLGRHVGGGERVGREDEAGEDVHLVAHDELLRQALGDVGRGAAGVPADELDLAAGDGVALLLHVELDGVVHLGRRVGELARVRHDQPDLDGRLGVRRGNGEEDGRQPSPITILRIGALPEGEKGPRSVDSERQHRAPADQLATGGHGASCPRSGCAIGALTPPRNRANGRARSNTRSPASRPSAPWREALDGHVLGGPREVVVPAPGRRGASSRGRRDGRGRGRTGPPGRRRGSSWRPRRWPGSRPSSSGSPPRGGSGR